MINTTVLLVFAAGMILGFALLTLRISVIFGMGLLLPLCYVLKPQTALLILMATYCGAFIVSFSEKRRWYRLRFNENEGFCKRALMQKLVIFDLIKYNNVKTKVRLTTFCIIIAIFLPILPVFFLLEIDMVQFLALSVFCITSVVCFQASNIPISDCDNKIRARFLSLFLSAISAMTGLLIPTIGIDVGTGAQRFSMGISELYGGIDFIIVVLGLCCLGEILYVTSERRGQPKSSYYRIESELINPSKLAELFSVVFLGIPFSQASAIIVGAFALYGISNTETLEIVFGVIDAEPKTISTLSFLFVLISFMQSIFKIVNKKIKKAGKKLLSPVAIYPIITVAAFVGAYSVNYRLFDLFMLIAFGLLGFIMRRLHFPITPLVVCAAFGPRLEAAFRAPFSWSPLTAVFYFLSVVILAIYFMESVRDGRS